MISMVYPVLLETNLPVIIAESRVDISTVICEQTDSLQ